MKRLAERRVLVVGASAGIGRATARVLGEEGARLAVAARRLDRLEQLAREIHGSAVAVPCDVRDPSACDTAVTRSVEALGGLDALVYTAGVAPLKRLADADAEDWRRTLEVNLVGASLVTRAALPHLARSRGRALYLSSIAAHEQPPRRGLPLYVASKAALDRLVALWQAEHPEVSFTRLSVGDTLATELAREWETDEGGAHVREWSARGLMFGRAQQPEAVARHLANLLASEEAVPVSSIVPVFPPK